MPKRYWFFVVAFGLALLPTVSASQEDIQQSEEEVNASASQKPETKPPSFVSALESIETAIRDLVAEENEQERKRVAEQAAKELEAQTEMAEWAAEVAIAAIAGAILTLFGLILIACTLRHTRRAADYAAEMVEEARRTTEAAQEATAETRRIGEAQVRAYLEFTESTSIAHYNLLRIRCQLVNIGQSPASQVNIEATLSYDLEFLKPSKKISPQQIGREGWVEFLWSDTLSESGVIGDIFSGKLGWFVHVEMSWVDVFGKKNATTIELKPHGGHLETDGDRREGYMIALLAKSSYGVEASKAEA